MSRNRATKRSKTSQKAEIVKLKRQNIKQSAKKGKKRKQSFDVDENLEGNDGELEAFGSPSTSEFAKRRKKSANVEELKLRGKKIEFDVGLANAIEAINASIIINAGSSEEGDLLYDPSECFIGSINQISKAQLENREIACSLCNFTPATLKTLSGHAWQHLFKVCNLYCI